MLSEKLGIGLRIDTATIVFSEFKSVCEDSGLEVEWVLPEVGTTKGNVYVWAPKPSNDVHKDRYSSWLIEDKF